ncbi:MAG: Gfo/Idh/MocA family oxidoreductase [Candidatus Thermoplasmatota archaeon]|nr:Gfo/Idh/MocA family oxidoreductase [Candidatus Thermoplasmatota archaeon]
MKQLRVAVIGMGFAGRLHCESYESLGEKAKIVVICDSNEERAKNYAEMFNAEACTDYHQLLNRKDIDAIDICAPHHLHVQLAVEAAKAGKHILCEKPIAITVEEADKIIDAAKKAGVTLMVAENHLFTPAHQKIKEIVDSGKVGRVFLVRAFEAATSELIMNPDPKDWRANPKNQGMLLDMAVHKFAFLRWVLGDIDSVFAIREKLVVTTLAPNYDDTALLIVKFKSGAVGEIVVTGGNPAGITNSTEVYGTDGTIMENHLWEKPVTYLSVTAPESNGEWICPEVEHRPYPGYYNISFRNEVAHFVDCVLNEKKPEMTGEDGREAVRAVIAATKSAEIKRFVKVETPTAKAKAGKNGTSKKK